MSDIHSQKILILDFGSQYTQLIARAYSRDWCVLRDSRLGYQRRRNSRV